ncbi:unnamed protein product [Polarella glacialis]|uniref:Acid phosphatase n=1 Tax=Polarella glacialis TaxID=89957 RepID=A0A813E1K0_POLGL|nr:unnamed protein product [Polarella glacialis]
MQTVAGGVAAATAGLASHVLWARKGRRGKLQLIPCALCEPRKAEVDTSARHFADGAEGIRQVRLVQVLHRHGARTPLALLPGMPAVGSTDWESMWGQCRRVRSSKQPVASEVEGSVSSLSFEGSASAGDASSEYGPCGMGQLTRLGERQLEALGSFLRGRYLLHGEGSGKGLLQDSHSPVPSEVAVFSTSTSRTILSAQFLLKGLFPSADGQLLADLVQVPHRDWLNETMVHNYASCDRLRQLQAEARSRVYGGLLTRHTLARLAEAIAGGEEEAQRLGVVGGGDPLRSLRAHGLPLPAGISEGLARDLDASGHALLEDSHGMGSLEVRRLGAGRLTADLDARIAARTANSQSPLRLIDYSAHDTSISGLLCALGLPQHRWADLASSIIIELLEDVAIPEKPPEASGHWHIRVLFYDGLPSEQGPQVDVTLTLAAWQAAVAPLRLSQAEYEIQCRMPPGMLKPPPHTW